MMIVDGLSMPVAERKWLEEYHAAKLSAVNTTLCVWENAPEALAVIARWRLLLEQCKDIAAQATSVAEIEQVAASGRTAIVFGFQNTAPVEHNLDLFGTFRDHLRQNPQASGAVGPRRVRPHARVSDPACGAHGGVNVLRASLGDGGPHIADSWIH